ncbi:glycosyltransferase [Rhizobium skierniewicense]|uniref:glycosyltransferase n=1 Tax=Rhizobium skierniewicense TaxID=984260 RepID=UPI00157250A7|nr:glycosyltransferase [Rhizobium skierniewicense]NTF34172.1 glycosyltransferase family 4 protein [Rhizobium skierniewicense]
MKICIVAQTFAPQEEGGAEIVARVCAAELSRHHDVIILSLGLEGDEIAPPGETVNDDGVRVLRVNWHNSYLPGPRKPAVGTLTKLVWHIRSALGATSAKDVKELLVREQIDLVYAHNSARMQPALFEATNALGIPLCLHLHDYALLCPKSSMFRGSGNCEKPCMQCRILTARITSSDGSGVTAISVSDALRQRFLQNSVLPKADWHVLINANRSEASFDASLLGRKSGTSEHFTFGYLGALAEEKGIEDLIRAFVRLPQSEKATLLIGGRGREDYVQHLKSLAGTSPIRFLGFVPPEDVYKMADVIVVPSRWHEPQSLILMEAATYGVPVIGTERGGTPEILRDLGTGWCYDPDEDGSLIKVMDRALNIGHKRWWQERNIHFPGIAGFKGTSESSGYYRKLNDILVAAAVKE